MFEGLLDSLGYVFLDDSILLASPPIRDLREAGAAEVCIQYRIRAPIGREKREQVLDPALLERASEMIHSRLGKISPQDRRQDVHRNVLKSTCRSGKLCEMRR